GQALTSWLLAETGVQVARKSKPDPCGRVHECQGVMRTVTRVRTRIGAMATIGLLVGAGSAAVAQQKGTAQVPYLRLEWEFDSARGAWQNACGRVYTDREVPARHAMS